MYDNCTPLEHFFFFLFFVERWTTSWKHAQTETTKCSSYPGLHPLFLLLSQLLRRVKGKRGQKNTAISGRTQSPNSLALTFKAPREVTHDWVLNSKVSLTVIYLFCLSSYAILFSVCMKQDLEKQHNTSPHFCLFLFFFLPKPGEKKLHFCTKFYKCCLI